MDPPSTVPSVSRDEQEEKNFRRLFTVILNKIINMEKVPEMDIAHAIGEMKDGFNIRKYRMSSSEIFPFPDITKWKNLCGYLFRYATHGAGLTRKRVLEAARNSEALASCLRSTDLRIVSLGGGPGNDIIGFCSALFEFLGESPSPSLNMTVVDCYEEWSICVTLLKKLVMEEKSVVEEKLVMEEKLVVEEKSVTEEKLDVEENLVMGESNENFSELLRFSDVRMSFLQVKLSADLTKDEDYFHFLQKADVILMVKLINHLDGKAIDSLMKTLTENMKNEALLLYIDAPLNDNDKRVIKHFDVLFQSELVEYCMSCEVNRRFFSDDVLNSTARIAVLRKKSSPPSKRRRME